MRRALSCLLLLFAAPAFAQVIEHDREIAAPPPETYDRPRARPGPTAAPPPAREPPAYDPPAPAPPQDLRPPPPADLRPPPVEERALSAPRLHTAREGETMDSIAALHGVSAADVERMNSLIRPYEIRAGDVIVLPGAPAPIVEASHPVELPRAEPLPGEPVAITPPPIAFDEAAHFLRPVSGRIVTRFGAQANGRRSDGVELEARAGTPIRAAADGDVVYAGDHVQGYGDLVLVRHADGYVTAYGYARNVRVREGQRVRRGETIAEAADRGAVLFQTRRGVTAEDPAPLLGE